MVKYFYSLTILFFLFSTLQSCKKEVEKVATPPKIEFKYEGDLQIIDSIGTLKKGFQIEIADNDFEQQTGLMYRKQMDTDKGMLFILKKLKYVVSI